MSGDLHLPNINWNTCTTSPNPQYGKTINEGLLNILNDHSLSQHVKEPTRCNNILDVFLTTYSDIVNSVKVIPGMSDHQAVVVVYCFKKGDMNAVKSDLNTISENIAKSGTSVEEKWRSLKEQIIETAKKHIHRKTLKEKYNIPWLPRSIKKIMK